MKGRKNTKNKNVNVESTLQVNRDTKKSISIVLDLANIRKRSTKSTRRRSTNTIGMNDGYQSYWKD